MMDRAAALNDAYALDQPLEHLLARHRLLALSRAPVRERLDVLRRIAEIDTTNNAWEKDIRVFERARLKELPTAFYNAVKKRDENAITHLMDEINKNTWFEPVPIDLATAVSDAFNRMQRAACEAELKKLVDPLRDAFAARSFQECRALAERWKKIMANYGVQRISPDLEDEIRPVVAFIHETQRREEMLKRFRESCRTFAIMLDRDEPDVQLESALVKLQEFKEPIPEDLIQRYENRKLSRQRAVERAHRVKLLSIGATVSALVLIALVVGWLFIRGNAAKDWADKIRQANANKDLNRANSYIEKLRKDNPSFVNDPVVAPAIAETAQLQARHDNEMTVRNGLVEQMDQADKTAAPVAANPNATIEETLEAAAAVQEALDKAQHAGDLSWVDSSDHKFANGIVRLQALVNGLRTRASAAIRRESEQLSARLDTLNFAPGMTAQLNNQLTQIANRLSELKAVSNVDDEAKNAVAALAAKLEQRRTSLASTQDVAGGLEQIRQAATTAE
jgi:hypothetical protein